MSNVKWTSQFGSGGFSASYVLDVATGSGSTQVYLMTNWPGDGSPLTQADADATAAAVQSAVDGLADVTSSVLTGLSVQGPPGTVTAGPPVVLLLDSADYALWLLGVTLPTEWGTSTQAQLLSASPADGQLSDADLATVTAALVTFLESLDTVTACTAVQQSVVPGTV
jgi:hypothetical protein